MTQLTSDEIVHIAESAVDTVAQNIESVKGNAANMAAITIFFVCLIIDYLPVFCKCWYYYIGKVDRTK